MRKFFALLLLISVVFVGCTVQAPANDDSDNGANSGTDAATEGFTLATEFSGGTMNYTVTGTMPTPCHTFVVEEIIAESFPEQVTLNIEVSEPGPAESCIQVIDTQTVSGKLNVDQNATVRLGSVLYVTRSDTAGAPGQ